jgi:hypothetical protein
VNAYMLQVRLDDGTVKDINCEYVRMLPPNFLQMGGGPGPLANGADAFAKEMANEVPPLTNTYACSKNKPNILLGKNSFAFVK